MFTVYMYRNHDVHCVYVQESRCSLCMCAGITMFIMYMNRNHDVHYVYEQES